MKAFSEPYLVSPFEPYLQITAFQVAGETVQTGDFALLVPKFSWKNWCRSLLWKCFIVGGLCFRELWRGSGPFCDHMPYVQFFSGPATGSWLVFFYNLEILGIKSFLNFRAKFRVHIYLERTKCRRFSVGWSMMSCRRCSRAHALLTFYPKWIYSTKLMIRQFLILVSRILYSCYEFAQ